MHTGKEENGWLLIKKQDDFATRQDVLLWDRSVVSGRDMEEIAEARDAEWRSNRERQGSVRRSGRTEGSGLRPPGSRCRSASTCRAST